jgi:proteasome lid subunit RPN8/RPN11
MSRVDVRDLAKESLVAGRFPANPRADFRLHLAPDVHRGIAEHARQDLSVEICGVLVGHWERDDHGPYTKVTNYIRCDNAASKLAEVTFTHESWAQINKEMDSRFADARIVGWYHSHPDFGIFLSDRDCFIHEHFFSGPGQVAYVVDPVRELEGVFAWRAGKPQPLDHYWVGDSIRTVDASQRKPEASSSALSARDRSSSDSRPDAPNLARAPSHWALTLLTWLCIFMLGYLYSALMNRWQQQMLEEGAVARYGVVKAMKYGLEENLEKVRKTVLELTEKLRAQPATTDSLTDEQKKDAVVQRQAIVDGLAQCGRFLAKLEETYGLSDAERFALLQIVSQAVSDSNARPVASSAPPDNSNGDATASKPGDGKANEVKSAPPASGNQAPAGGTSSK